MIIQLITHIVYNKKIVRTTFVLLILIQNFLGIFNVFINPIPFPPRTSIGLMTGVTIAVLGIVAWMYRNRFCTSHAQFSLVDGLVLLFISFHAASLLFAPAIYQLTSFRILLIAGVQYGSMRMVELSTKEKRVIVLSLSIVAIAISCISILEALFPNAAMTFSRAYLFGDAAYGVVWEIKRGRIPHLGNLTIAAPFFFGALFYTGNKSFLRRLERLVGIACVPFSFFISNFRWITLCFIICISYMTYLLNKFHYIQSKHIIGPLVIAIATGIGALCFASVVLHYNLVDRFLARDFDRDITVTTGRLYLYNQAVEVFLSSPIVGVGIGNYSYLTDPIIGVDWQDRVGSLYLETNKQPISSHNEVLTILAEGGVVALVIFAWINASIITHIFKRIFELHSITKEERLHQIIFLISLLAYYLYGVLENTAPNNLIIIFFIYGASASWLKRKPVVSHLQ